MTEIRIELDRVRKLKYSLWAIGQFDKQQIADNQPIFEKMAEGGSSFLSGLNLLWAGFLLDDEQLTPRALSEILEKYWFDKGRDFAELMATVNEAMAAAGFGEKGGEEKPGKPKASKKLPKTRKTPA